MTWSSGLAWLTWLLALAAGASSSAGCRPYRLPPASPTAVRPVVPGTPPHAAPEAREVFKLANGLTVVLEECHAAPVVAVQAWIAAGAGDDPPGQEGVGHLFQHLLLISDRGRPAGETAARDLTSLGGTMGVWSSYDETVLHAVVASAYTDSALALLAGALTRPPLGPEDVEAALRAARLDLRQTAMDPERIAAEAAFKSAFVGPPYGRSVLGTEAALAAISVDDVRAFWDRHYGAANTTVVIVGDLDRAAIHEQVSAAFGGMRPGSPPEARPRVPPALASASAPAPAPRIAISTADVSQPVLVVAFRTPDLLDADVPALELLAALLGPGRGGRLDRELGRGHSLATPPGGYLFSSRDGGLLVATASLGPGRVHEAARVLVEEVLRLARELVSPEELARARTLVEGGGAERQSGLDGTARRLGLFAAVAGDPGFEEVYLARLRAVDVDALKEVAARSFRLANLAVAVVLPAWGGRIGRDDRAAALEQRLRAVVSAAFEPAQQGSQSQSQSAASVASAASAALVTSLPATSSDSAAQYALPSGVRLLVLTDRTAPEVSVRALWSGGVRLEDARLAGATWLLARLLPRGSKTRDEDQIADELGAIAGRLDGIAGIDSLGLRGDFLASHWERGIDLMMDCLRNPRLADEQLERERRVVLEAIRIRDDDPGELAQRLFRETLFGQHPYRRDLLGTPEAITSLDRRRLLDAYRRVYPLSGLIVAIVGPVPPDRVAEKVQSLLADVARPPSLLPTLPLPPGSRRQPSPSSQPWPSGPVALPSAGEPTEVFQLISKPQARLVIGYPGVTVRDPDRLALELLAEILGGSGGRLATSLVNGGLADTVAASSQEGADPGYFAVRAGVRPDDVDALVPALRAELSRVTRDGVTPDEVLRARRMLVGTRSLALEHRGAVALELALRAAVAGMPGSSTRRDIDELASITAADVNRVARRILDPEREVLAVVRPHGGERPATSSNDCCSAHAAR